MKTKTTLGKIVAAYFIEAGFGNFLDAELVWAAETLRKIAARCDQALRERLNAPESPVPYDAPDPRD